MRGMYRMKEMEHSSWCNRRQFSRGTIFSRAVFLGSIFSGAILLELSAIVQELKIILIIANLTPLRGFENSLAYARPSQTSNTELFTEILNGLGIVYYFLQNASS